jgi:predicted phage-related endonuclease
MELNKESQLLIESAINKAIKRYKGSCERTELTDIHIQPNQNSGGLLIFDDDDKELANVIIKEWINYQEEIFYENIERILRNILAGMRDAGHLKDLNIITPYSFILVDEDKEVLSELMLVDDDIMLLSDNLLNGLDKELENFLKDLLKA